MDNTLTTETVFVTTSDRNITFPLFPSSSRNQIDGLQLKLRSSSKMLSAFTILLMLASLGKLTQLEFGGFNCI